MPHFDYRALNRQSNKEVKGSIEAPNQAEAIAKLKKDGLLPIEVRAGKAKKAGSGSNVLSGLLAGRVSAQQVTDFTRQLSTLIDAGLPIVQSLQILTDMQRPGGFHNAMSQVTEEVQGGSMLSDAMSRHKRIWDELYTNMVKAGESAGALETVMRRLAEFREKAQKLKKQMISAMVYPAAVTFIAIAILTFIMLFIVPRFTKIFEDLGVPLPPPTVLLINASGFVGGYWWVIIIGVVGAVYGLKALRATEAGGNAIDRVALHAPVLGNLIKKSSVARFTRTLGTLVASGVGFLEALEITRGATPNIVVRNAIADVRDSVKEGESINAPLARSGVFNDIVVNMIKVGEETGELDKMLSKIADTYDEEVDDAIQAMMSLLEPALIVFMGGAVGFIVVALFMPLIKVISSL
jgi:type IV pilus assembly protein PilC